MEQKDGGLMVKKYSELVNFSTKVFLETVKGRYDLEWLRFMTENGIEEFPLIPGINYRQK